MLDLQSPCPGGRKKKIKECCPDLVKELDQVYTMLDGKQYSACVNLIETLEKTHSDCTCLLLAKAIACRLQQKNDEAFNILLPLSKKESDNSRVLTELCLMYIVQGKFKEAISCVIDALETFPLGSIDDDVFEMMLILSESLVRTNQFIPAMGLLNILRLFGNDENNPALSMVVSVYGDPRVPPIFKSLIIAGMSAGKAVLPDQYNENCLLATQGHWKKALAGFETMALDPKVPSVVFWSLALLYLWTYDLDKGLEYLKRYITASDTDQDDAVDAQILAGYLQRSILDDNIRVRRLAFTVFNQEDAMEKFLSEPTFAVLDADFSQIRDESGSPPPQKAFLILDKARRSILSAEEDPDALPPQILAQVFFFGKQTDREARVVLMEVPESEMMTLENKLRAVLGDDLGAMEENDDFGEMSETDLKLFPRFYFHDNPELETNTEKYHNQYSEKVFVPWWLNHALGLLNGKTPLEASKMPELRVSLLAAITAFEYKIQEPEIVDALEAKLRTLLELPPLQMIDDIAWEDSSEEQNLEMFVPIWRWKRIDFTKVPSNVLLNAFASAKVMAQIHVAGKIAELLLERTDITIEPMIKMSCLDVIVSKAFAIGDSEQIHLALDKAYNYSLESGTSDGHWHIMELMNCARQNNGPRFEQLLQHLTTEHRNEQDIMSQLSQLMVQLGLIPGARGGAAESPMMPGMPGMPGAAPAATQPAKEPGGLWTPDSDNSSAGQGGSKLWIPGND